MAGPDAETISHYARKSDSEVMLITWGFAIIGLCLEIIATAIAVAKTQSGIPLFAGLWMGFCYMTIPPIYYLCRRCQLLQRRLDEIEERLENRSADSVEAQRAP